MEIVKAVIVVLVPKTIPLTALPATYRSSAYNMFADTATGDWLVVNTLSGANVLFPAECAAGARELLAEERITVTDDNRELVNQLVDAGVLVQTRSDERRQLRYLQAHQTSSQKQLHLILFPTEKCNFRCVYCYEDFVQGKMSPEVRSAVKKLIRKQTRSLQSLTIDWFGGEPLLAKDVIYEILSDARESCEEHHCALTGHITTNGYLLDPETARRLVELKVESFQITVDGPKEEHNRRRKLYQSGKNGGGEADAGTFDRIIENVRALLHQHLIFNLQLRTNYDLDSLPLMESWIDTLKELVGDDPRVRVDFCPIWADPCKVDVSIAMGPEKQRTYARLLEAAHARGLRTNAANYLGLGGLVCYAAKANSLVIRSNGLLNKCTVALDSDFNSVGRLRDDGTLELDIDKFSLWTSSGLEQDTTCQGCALSASCQGNACPLERFENHRRPCPPPKNFPETLLKLVIPCS